MESYFFERVGLVKALRIGVLMTMVGSPLTAFGQTTFTQVAPDLGMDGAASTHGLAFGDYDNDGWYDLYVTNFDAPSILYRNNGDGTFTDVTVESGAEGPDEATGVAWGDYDNDGWVDLLIASDTADDRLYRNNGDGTFANVTDLAGIGDHGQTRGASWADYDNDGLLDFFLAGRFGSNKADALYHNNGDGTFTDMAPALGMDGQINTFGGIWFDFDNDRDQDLYLPIDFADDQFYLNNGDGTFTDITEQAGFGPPEHAMGVAIGDYDNDGDLDIFVDNNQQGGGGTHGPSLLFNNNGDGTFTDVTEAVGLTDRGTVDWGTNFIDYDHDGDLDLAVVAGGLLSEGEDNVLFDNNGAGFFTDVTAETFTNEFGAAYGSAWADYDGDGDLDWFVVNELNQPNAIFRNDGPVANWVAIKPQGVISNRSGIGARIEITIDGVTQIREIAGGASYLSQDPMEAWFGIADAAEIDSARVLWPSGEVDELFNLAANERYHVVEGETSIAEPEVISLATADVTIIGADSGERSSSYNVALGSDVNGDGYADIIIGAPRADIDGEQDAGRVYIVFGRSDFDGTIDLNDADVTINGISAVDVTGLYLYGRGDVNDDGFDDVLIGAPRADGENDGLLEGGDGYILLGRPNWNPDINLATQANVILYAAEFDSRACGALNVGDFNNDGIDDVICGARGASPNGIDKLGEAYVLYGRRFWPEILPLEDADVTIQGTTEAEQLGFSIGANTDINGDGFQDLAIGAWWADAPGADLNDNSGAVYIFFGSDNPASFLDPSMADVTFRGTYSRGNLGVILDTSGDVNGDGIADILLGAHETTGGTTGEAYLVYGSADLSGEYDLNQADVRFIDTGIGDPGNDGTLDNDINNDGYADIVIANATADVDGADGAGEVYVIYGGPELAAEYDLRTQSDQIYQGIGVQDQAGTAVAMTGGDIDGDGLQDFAVGAISADPTSELADAGATYLFLSGAGEPGEPPAEVLTVIRAQWISAANFLEVNIESSLGAEAVLNIEGFGELNYRENTGRHSARFTGVESNPGTIKVTSTGGAELEVAVTDN